MEARVLMPQELSLVLSLQPDPNNILEMHVALWSNKTLPPGTRFFPDQGATRMDKLELYSVLEANDIRYKYGCQDEIVNENDKKVRHCNWVRFLKISNDLADVNIVGVKVKGQIIFQTTKTILPNEEMVALLQPEEEMEVDQVTGSSDVGSTTPDLKKVKREVDVTSVSPLQFPGSRDLLTSPPSREDDCKSSVSEGTNSSDLNTSPHSANTSETERYSDPDLSPPFLSSYPQQLSPLNLSSERTPAKYRSPPGLSPFSSMTSPFSVSVKSRSPRSPMTSPLSSSTDKSPSPSTDVHFRPKRNRERTWLPCDVCGKKFDRPSLLKRHIRTHTGEKPHACDVCGKAFSTSSSLNTHRRIHSGEKPHQCGVCGKRFTASSNLYYHRMTHNKEKPHKCQLCSKSFPTPGDLRSHMYVHNGSWPYRCDVCNRGFSKQTNLKNHLLLHTGDKPHECPTCQKKFALYCNLKTHLKTHEEDNQGSCISCGRTYLKKHDVTSDKCRDCIRSESPGSSPKQSRVVSDFSISKLTNNDDTREKMTSPTQSSAMFDPRYLPNVYGQMMLMAPPSSHCIPPQPFSFGLVPVFSRFSQPEVRSLGYPAGLVPGLTSPLSVNEGFPGQVPALRRDWSGLLAK